MFKLVDNAKQAIIIVLLATLAVCAGYIAYDHYSDLKTELAGNKKALDEVTAERNKLQDEINRRNDYDQREKKTDAEFDKKQQEQESKISDAEKAIAEKAKQIEQKYEQKEKNQANEQARQMELSLERSKGAWKVFCIVEPKHEFCSEP